MAQPYSKFLVEMLEPQRYPEVRLQPGKDILRPYDVATWTLPLAMGVTVERTQTGVNAAASAASGWKHVTEIHPEPEAFVKAHEGQGKPRVAIYNPWGGALDEGWTRWLLDQYGFAPKSLHPQEVKAGLKDFDALILPDISPEVIATGRGGREEGGVAMRYNEELPPEDRGSLEKAGAHVLRGFVENGGTLVAMGAGCDYVIQEFNIPVRNALAKATQAEFSVPGSLVRVHVRNDHPVTAGMPEETAVFIDRPMAF